jgi:hypothetical protein
VKEQQQDFSEILQGLSATSRLQTLRERVILALTHHP